MLGVKYYPRDYVEACRAKVEADVASYNGAVGKANAPAFETTFFNNMVLLLELSFVHRLRTMEGKDGNALNEVRMICDSILEHRGVMTAEKPIKLVPEKTVLKYRFGDEIKVTEADFRSLSRAFFAEIESKFVEPD